jgi:hypothetical protein
VLGAYTPAFTVRRSYDFDDLEPVVLEARFQLVGRFAATTGLLE